jgi:hypothetical protein
VTGARDLCGSALPRRGTTLTLAAPSGEAVEGKVRTWDEVCVPGLAVLMKLVATLAAGLGAKIVLCLFSLDRWRRTACTLCL